MDWKAANTSSFKLAENKMVYIKWLPVQDPVKANVIILF